MDKARYIVMIKFELLQLKKMLDIVKVAGDEIIHSNNGITIPDKPVAQVRSKKPGCASDQYSF